ncbi:MAG: hypothetical protein JXK16_11715 [Thiotrichales bacterium]|nr:hypothetical protein [Thiotrichales bacterium]
MATKDKATPEAKTQTAVQETKEVETAKGMAKIVTVYVVKSELASVNFPTKARAKAAFDLLTMFKVSANIETVKKTINI